MRYLLSCSLFLLFLVVLGACATTEGNAAIVATVPLVVQILNSWLDAGVLTPEQHKEAMVVFNGLGSSIQSMMELVRIVNTKASSGVSAEGATAIASGITLAGGAILNGVRNKSRAVALKAPRS